MYSKWLEQIKKEFTIDGKLNQRYLHTIGVIEMALTLNSIHKLNIDEKKVFEAACFHDVAKFIDSDMMRTILEKNYPDDFLEMVNFPAIWHSFVGKIYAKEKYQITDEEVLDAIKYHTTGHPKMTSLEKIIFISDYIEKITRTEKNFVEARLIAFKNLDEALKTILASTISYLKSKNYPIYKLTLDTYKYYSKGQNDV